MATTEVAGYTYLEHFLWFDTEKAAEDAAADVLSRCYEVRVWRPDEEWTVSQCPRGGWLVHTAIPATLEEGSFDRPDEEMYAVAEKHGGHCSGHEWTLIHVLESSARQLARFTVNHDHEGMAAFIAERKGKKGA